MIRTYEHIGPELTETITVHVTEDGYVRMRADNLHDMLSHLGFIRTDVKANA